MAVSMWRMNGLWRRMAGVLVLCTLLLSNEVICQDDSVTDAATAADLGGDSSAVTDVPAPAASSAPTVDSGDGDGAGGGEDSAVSAGPEVPATIITIDIGADNPNVDLSGTIASTLAKGVEVPAVNENSDVSNVVKKVVPTVKCVGENDIPESNAVKAMVATADCLGVTKVETPSSSGSSVFVGILVTGLLAALAMTIGYLKCQRRTDTKGVKLAEEAYPVDQENQGNTLVSVAPLNPPPETQEKPSVNGESPEAAKTQPPPPTNGHSTAKTADTEL
uniref:Uncharacterized protein n=1 Tax=Lates calcarifer TaxID=8187 RepID=A0A4W6FLX2_LATCA